MAKESQPVYFDRFRAGLYTNRSPLAVPTSNAATAYAYPHPDALIDGSNVEQSARDTVIRRAGYPTYCSSAFGSSEWPLNFWSGILNNSAGAPALLNLVDTQTNIYSFTSGAKTSIFTKNTSAQTFFQQVGPWLYFSDGVENMKWDGTNAPSNSGVASPTVNPTITALNLYDTVGAAQTLHAWVPNYAYNNATSTAQGFFLLAPTGEMQWAVVPKGTTLTSQSTVPNWQAVFGVFGGVTLDGTMTWTNCGPLTAWAANTLYKNATYVTTTQMSSSNLQASGVFTAPTLATSGVLGNANWQRTTVSAGMAPTVGNTGNSNTLTATGFGLTVPSNATIQGIVVTIRKGANRVNAVQDVTVKLLKAGTAVGNNKAASGSWPQIMWNQYVIPSTGGIPTNYGSNTDLWGTTWTPTDIANANFGVEFIVNVSSTSTTTAGITFGEGTSPSVQITVYYITAAGDLNSSVYAQIVTDSNGNLQGVKTAGTTGGSAPSWSTTIGGTTSDGGVTWQCLGTAAQLPALFNWTYAYGYHTLSPHLSTMSAFLTVYAPMIGPNVPVTGTGSADTQVDRCDVYRTVDGGALLFFDNSAPNVNASTTFTIQDTILDINLNNTLVGPIAHVNDPPPSGMTQIIRYMGRMWGVVGNLLYFSAGPDCTNGNGDQAWPPANVFVLPSGINALNATSQGLVVMTVSQLWAVLGGPTTLSFYLQPILNEMGVLSPNCSASDSDTIYLLTSNAQLVQLTFSGKTEIGFPVADVLSSTFPPSTSYLTVHRNGVDEGLFLSDGSSHIIRFSLRKGAWSPVGTLASGIGALASVQTAAGVFTLLAGRATGSGNILGRSLTNFVDGASSTYSGYATIGSIILAPPSTLSSSVDAVFLQAIHTGTALTVSVLPNEISGSFTALPFQANDPWQLPASATVDMRRYDWANNASALPKLVKHVQVKVSFAAENFASELLAMGITHHPVLVS